MKRRPLLSVLLCLLAITVFALMAAPAQAVVGGQHDDGSAYPNVGMVFIENMGFASCTLVSEDVVLTAGHVAAELYNMEDPTTLAPGVRAWVSFNPDADPGDLSTSDWTEVERADLPLEWFDAPVLLHGVPMKVWLAPGYEDVAVLKLEEPVTGIEFAKVADADGLSGINLQAARFTVVGFGMTGFGRGSFAGWNSQTWLSFDGRNYRQDLYVSSEHWLYADRYLMTSVGSAPGDSGGPLLHDGVITAVVAGGQGMTPNTPGFYYRLDTTYSQTLLHKWLPSSAFAALD